MIPGWRRPRGLRLWPPNAGVAERLGTDGKSMAAVRGSDVLETSQVRIYSSAGRVIGAGFLVAAAVVCTCAHAVARALGESDVAEQAPRRPVDLDFPLLVGRPRERATVVSRRGGGADVVLLRLDAAAECGVAAVGVVGSDPDGARQVTAVGR
ncbi:hypothetical protein SAMN06272771_6744 [Streptomyces sp. Ag82_O1-12]|uniref:hypothetical protein n=1 Tax=unclassified Streptomyces TaxID=2593676 RepID=UPI000BC5EE49|nr:MULTISPECIES: hypothetical protein [unclassified Streptomyces]SMQ20404.1 hypothetical protein SAMN06272771_6744 [Streptomyces sp. Ag82_O1-12]SOD49278.1 hypothetical protein SAMN06272727_6750 [Streptomyces sp. Ag82_G6-1]